MLFASSSSSPEEEEKNSLVQKVLDFFSNFILAIWKPIRRLVRLFSKIVVGKETKDESSTTADTTTTTARKSLQNDFESKLEMLTDEEVKNGAVKVVETSPPPTAVSKSGTKEDIATAAPDTEEKEPETATTTTAVLEEKVDSTVATDELPSIDVKFTKEKEPESATITTAVLEEKVDSTVEFPSIDVKFDLTRTAVAAPDVDLSGNWSMIISESFKKDYDEYLKKLGQPLIVRSVALGIVGMTTEETIQTNKGRELQIRGKNARGMWERTLYTSQGAAKEDYIPLVTDIVTADAETVSSEAWWEDGGRIHKSWLRGGSKYGGGDFESKRYLENDGKVLVCESVFHPNDKTREKAQVTWKFLRDGAEL